MDAGPASASTPLAGTSHSTPQRRESRVRSVPTALDLYSARKEREGRVMSAEGMMAAGSSGRERDRSTASDAEVSIQLQFRTNSVLEDMQIERSASHQSWGKGPFTSRVGHLDGEAAAALETDVHLVHLEMLERRLSTTVDKGLDEAVAEARLAKEGKNMLQRPKDLPLFVKFILYLFEGFGLLLWAAAILCFIAWYPLSYKEHGGFYNLALSVCLVIVIILSGLFNFMQERRSSKVMEQFRQLLPSKAKVLRKGVWTSIDAQDIVRGDIITVKAGEKIPADIRVVSTKDGKVDKSALTGETESIPLTVACTDHNHHETQNLAHFGTLMTEGEVVGLVVATGQRTTMGSISDMVNKAGGQQTTLHVEVNHFVRIVATLAIVTGVVSFAYWGGSLRVHHKGFLDLPTMIVNCISLIVAYVPLGLPVSVTLTLSLIAAKMAYENVLVKKLGIVDTLGCVSTIASDKTGTLTENRMTAAHLVTLKASLDQTSGQRLPYVAHLQEAAAVGQVDGGLEHLFRAAVLCSRADYAQDKENMEKPMGDRRVDGDATETGIFRFCCRVDYARVTQTRKAMPKASELPFNSRRKWQLSLHSIAVGSTLSPKSDGSKCSFLVMKGAPERILPLCSRASVPDLGDVALSADGREAILRTCEELAAQGERVLGLCDRLVPNIQDGAGLVGEQLADLANDNMRFIGFISLMDPPRAEVPKAVETCRQAGVRVMMVTGDHQATAAAIARKTGIITADRVCGVEYLANITDEMLIPKHGKDMPALVLTGDVLGNLDDAMWSKLLKHDEIVFARTTPAQKLLIARNVQSTGQRMAMTGDGVNDAPALRQADVGIAMGKGGTDVAKEAASIILLDDNFSSIVHGIKRGRLAFENLKKIVSYLLPAGSFSEATPIIANVFLGMPLPLSSFLMIIICMLTDVSGSITLVYEEAENDLMRVPPRDAKKDKLVDFRLMCYGFLQLGVYESFVGFFMYFLAMNVFSHGRLNPKHLVFAWEKWTNDADYHGLSLEERNVLLYKGQTAYFVGLVMVQIWNLLGVARTRRGSLFRQRFNKFTLLGATAEIFIVLLIVFIPPINDVFRTRPLPFVFFLYPFLLGIGLMLLMELFKYVRSRNSVLDRILGW